MDRFYKLFNMVKDDLKKAYLSNPSVLWAYPCVVFDTKKNGPQVIDGKYPEEVLIQRISEIIKNDKLKCIIIGRMGVKFGDLLGPDGKPVVKEKNIIITGKNFLTQEVRTLIIPCKEHYDLRFKEDIEKDHSLIDLTFPSPDLSKFTIIDNKEVFVTAKFGKEQLYTTKDGLKVIYDPIIDSLEKKEKVFRDINFIENINKGKKDIKNPFEEGK